MLHAKQISLEDFVRLSGDANRRDLAAQAASDDEGAEDMGAMRRRPNSWYGERAAPAVQPQAAALGRAASATPGAAPACDTIDRDGSSLLSRRPALGSRHWRTAARVTTAAPCEVCVRPRLSTCCNYCNTIEY